MPVFKLIKLLLRGNCNQNAYEAFLSFFFLFSSISYIYPPPIQDFHPQGLASQMPVGQMPVGGEIVYGPEH